MGRFDDRRQFFTLFFHFFSKRATLYVEKITVDHFFFAMDGIVNFGHILTGGSISNQCLGWN